MHHVIRYLIGGILLTLVSCSSSIGSQSQPPHTLLAVGDRFIGPTGSHDPPPHIPQILAIGDSLTGGYFASDQAHDYLSLVTNALHAQAIDTHGTYGISALRTLPGLLSTPPPHADIMIVELGTNDGNSTNPETTDQFATAYSQILHILRSTNPQAKLVCLGTWQDHSADARDVAIQSACQAERGVYRPLTTLYYFNEFIYHGPTGRTTWLGKGDWFHPNDLGHAAIARLVEYAINGTAAGDDIAINPTDKQ